MQKASRSVGRAALSGFAAAMLVCCSVCLAGVAQPSVEKPSSGAAPRGFQPSAIAVEQTPRHDTGANSSSWQIVAPLPYGVMDEAVVGYNGKIYVLGGYGANGWMCIYDPGSDQWTMGAQEPWPYIGYPMGAALGLDDQGHACITLFPDTASGNTQLHRYDIGADTWSTVSVPDGFPTYGQWASRIVSLLTLTGENVCYISGGATTPGTGNLKTLWRYHPDTNTIENLGEFTHSATGFDFHATWYVPWVGTQGAIAVAGGIDANGTALNTTQCYDIASATFNAVNADLGALPTSIWACASMQSVSGSTTQLWYVSGMGGWGSIFSFYYSTADHKWHFGPMVSQYAYRLGGASDGQLLHIVGGAISGFDYQNYHQVFDPSTVQPFYVWPDEGGPGVYVYIYGDGFGATKGKVTFGSSSGKVDWWDTTGMVIGAVCSGSKMVAGTYDVKVYPKVPKGAPPIVSQGVFSLRAPTIVNVDPPAGVSGDTITVNGRCFGAKGTLSLRSGGTTYKTKASEWWETGAQLVVSSKLPAGTYDVTVTTSLGTDTLVGAFTKP